MRALLIIVATLLLMQPAAACVAKDQVIRLFVPAIAERVKLSAKTSEPLREYLNATYPRGTKRDPVGTQYMVWWMDDLPTAAIYIFDESNCYTGLYTERPKGDVMDLIGGGA